MFLGGKGEHLLGARVRACVHACVRACVSIGERSNVIHLKGGRAIVWYQYIHYYT